MSTVKVSNIQHASAASAAITLDANGQATLNGLAFPTSGSLSGRNRIINGDMRIDQRNAGASISISNNTVTYTVDRWLVYSNNDGFCSMQQVSDAPAGFVKSLKFTTTTADASLSSTQRALIQHRIEGFNASDFGWGAVGAQTITLSFWVKSSLTGSFGAAIQSEGVDRAYPFSYTINSANTWEKKTVTIAGDITGTWATENTCWARLTFSMGAGSTYSGTANAWVASDLNSVTGAVSVIGTLNATWQITGVQLEAGSAATPFERRSYGQELALAQRYFQTRGGDNTYETVGSCTAAISTTLITYYPVPLFVKMRSSPSISISGTWRVDDMFANSFAVTNINADTISNNSSQASIAIQVASGLTQGRVYLLQANNNTAARLNLSSEL